MNEKTLIHIWDEAVVSPRLSLIWKWRRNMSEPVDLLPWWELSLWISWKLWWSQKPKLGPQSLLWAPGSCICRQTLRVNIRRANFTFPLVLFLGKLENFEALDINEFSCLRRSGEQAGAGLICPCTLVAKWINETLWDTAPNHLSGVLILPNNKSCHPSASLLKKNYKMLFWRIK